MSSWLSFIQEKRFVPDLTGKYFLGSPVLSRTPESHLCRARPGFQARQQTFPGGLFVLELQIGVQRDPSLVPAPGEPWPQSGDPKSYVHINSPGPVTMTLFGKRVFVVHIHLRILTCAPRWVIQGALDATRVL